jgi:hypothetical protein
MAISKQVQKEMDRLPPALRAVLDAELATGNEIVELRYGFPAAPVGVSFMLARAIRQKLPERGPGVTCYNRQGSDYAGEITDESRHFFLLEPPRPYEPPQPPPGEPEPDPIVFRLPSFLRPESDLVTRFRRSHEMNYEKWHDGIGCDLDAIREATPAERQEIEEILLHCELTWREVEALAVLNTPRARQVLREALKSGDASVKSAVINYAGELVSQSEKTQALVEALATAEIYAGLSVTLLEVEEHHPPEVIAALLRGTLERDGGTACHYSAMLYFLHGKAKEPFDWDHRPLFLRFNTPDPVARRQCFIELCADIGVDPAPYLVK